VQLPCYCCFTFYKEVARARIAYPIWSLSSRLDGCSLFLCRDSNGFFHFASMSLFSSGYWGLLSQVVKLTTQLHLVLRLRMCGAVAPVPKYNFMAWCLVKHSNNFTFFISLI